MIKTMWHISFGQLRSLHGNDFFHWVGRNRDVESVVEGDCRGNGEGLSLLQPTRGSEGAL